MASPQDYYTDALRTGQEAFNSAVDMWTKAAQQSFGPGLAGSFPTVDPTVLVDQGFDLAEKLLQSQRQLVKTLALASNNVSEAVQQQVETVADRSADITRKAARKATSTTKS